MWRIIIAIFCFIMLLCLLGSLTRFGKPSPTIDAFVSDKCEKLDWLKTSNLEIKNDEAGLIKPAPFDTAYKKQVDFKDTIDDIIPTTHHIHPIKVQTDNVVLENNAIFNDRVTFEDDDVYKIQFNEGIHANSNVNINSISMRDITLDNSKLQDIHTNIRKVNELFTDYYLIDPMNNSIAKLLPRHDIIDKHLKCSSLTGDELSECKRKEELIKEMIEIVRDDKPADSENGLCKKLNCPTVFKKRPEKHHCRAILLNRKNDKTRSIDLRADEDSNAVYYETKNNSPQSINVYFDDVNDISEKNYRENDDLNTVLLYKSNDDTKCELTFFRSGEHMETYIINPDKPDLKFPCRYANNGKKIPRDLMQVYSPDKFTKFGNMETIRTDNMCQKRSRRKIKKIDAMYLRVLNR